jgi:hypothetical protein
VTAALGDALGPDLATGVAVYLAGLVGFLAAYAAITALAGRIGGFERPARAFAATVLPIAAAYELAHNYGYVLTTIGRLPHAVGGWGFDPLFWLSTEAFWWSQVALIVAGHVVAVLAADAAARERAPDLRSARTGHAPLVVLMVGYTVLSLWIISRPIAA